MEHWLQSWERIYEDATALQLPIVVGDQPLFDFVDAIRTIDAYFASTQEYHIKQKKREGQTIDLYDLIEDFRDHHRCLDAQRSLDPGSGSHSAFATFKDQSQDKKKTCLCGRAHLYHECYYLNSETRPPNWQGKPETFAKINEKLNQSSMKRLKKALWRDYKYDASTLPASQPLAPQPPAPQPLVPQPPRRAASNSASSSTSNLGGFATYSAFSQSGDYKLYDC